MSNALQVQQEERRSLVEQIKHPKMQAQIQASLPPSVSLSRFTAVTIAAINHNPDLTSADRQSFYNAVVRAAQEGLLPDGQDAFLNIYPTNVGTRDQPRWIRKVQYQRMVGGVIKQFKKAGIDAYACCVYENEDFTTWNDEAGQHISHKLMPFSNKRGEMIGAYAVAPMPSGKPIVAFMDMEAIGKARDASKSKEGPAWRVWFDRMAEKSVLHRLRKRVAILDEEAAAELNKLDDEFEDEEVEEQSTAPPQQPIPTGNEERPKSLQAIVDQGGPPPDDDHGSLPPADERIEGDII